METLSINSLTRKSLEIRAVGQFVFRLWSLDRGGLETGVLKSCIKKRTK